MTEQRIAKVEYGDPELAYLFETSHKKINDTIRLTDEDVRSKTIVYCNEPYAPELFNAYVKRMNETQTVVVSKDVNVGDEIEVVAKSYNLKSKVVSCEGVSNGAYVTVPMSEFIYDVNTITPDFKFKIVVLKAENGAYSGTCKNPKKYREEIAQAHAENTWFTVKLMSLIRGGYRALYKGTIECFVPGSHAAANIIEDFNKLIGQELPVMVDNYDWSSRMYVVSYKKYVKHSLPEKIHELKFGHKYTGRLTSNPTEFGLFIEFENYYTGLAHRVDFGNYDEICKQYKAGDVVDVYVKNVTEKKGNYRIILTFNEADVDTHKMTWYKFKTTCEKKTLPYAYDQESRAIAVTLDSGETINISLPHDFNTNSLKDYRNIKIHDVNVLRQEIKFDFCN